MSCKTCEAIVERPDVPHVVRNCPECGREIHIVDPGDHGIGIRVQKGDRFVIPEGWIKLSLNPLHSTVRLARAGLDMLARKALLDKFYPNVDTFYDDQAVLEKETDDIMNAFKPLEGLDINNPEDSERIFTIMNDHPFTREYWALWTGHFLAMSRGARSDGDHKRAAWAAACAERCRSMMIFKEALEDVVWMGLSVKRVLDLLSIWNGNQTNSDEGFWQATFTEHSYALSQVFAVPVVFFQNKAYVGGTRLDGSESKFVDYLLSAESSRESILVEIKTPATKLLGGNYRDNPTPSRELSGSIVQVLNYRAQLIDNLQLLIKGTERKLSAFSPKCMIIIGNAKEELLDEAARKAFEMYRGNQKDVEIITYDELFRKTEILAELFGLVHKDRMPRNPA